VGGLPDAPFPGRQGAPAPAEAVVAEPAPRPAAAVLDNGNAADLISLAIIPKPANGSSIVIDFEARNNTDRDLRDVVVVCKFYDDRGTKLGETKRTAYRRFPKLQTVTIEEINFGFAKPESRRVTCEAVSVDRLSTIP
jgi:hypothetical protein